MPVVTDLQFRRQELSTTCPSTGVEASAEQIDLGLDDLPLKLAVCLLGDQELAGQIRDEREDDPSGRGIQTGERVSFDLLDPACLRFGPASRSR